MFLASLSAFWRNIFEANQNDLDVVHVISMPGVPVSTIEEMHSLILADWPAGQKDNVVPDRLIDAINVYSQSISEEEPILIPQIRSMPPKPILRPMEVSSSTTERLKHEDGGKDDSTEDVLDAQTQFLRDDFAVLDGEDYTPTKEGISLKPNDESESQSGGCVTNANNMKSTEEATSVGFDDDMAVRHRLEGLVAKEEEDERFFDETIVFPSDAKAHKRYAHEVELTEAQKVRISHAILSHQKNPLFSLPSFCGYLLERVGVGF